MTQTALITGASNGIGRELAVLCAKDKHDLVLVARSENKLNQLAKELNKKYGVQVKVIAKDLQKMDAIQEVYEATDAENIEVDILINNAGFGLFGEFLNTEREDELNMIDLNIKSLTYLTKLYLPSMVKRKRGKVMNVASTAAFQPGPLMAVYYATKAYVLSFSEALENELKGTGVSVTALCPGATETGFSNRANLEESKLFKSGVMDVETVSNIGYRGMMKGQSLVIPGFQNRMLTCLVRFLPRKIVPSIVRRVQERV